jgi:hypothetical protein
MVVETATGGPPPGIKIAMKLLQPELLLDTAAAVSWEGI